MNYFEFKLYRILEAINEVKNVLDDRELKKIAFGESQYKSSDLIDLLEDLENGINKKLSK